MKRFVSAAAFAGKIAIIFLIYGAAGLAQSADADTSAEVDLLHEYRAKSKQVEAVRDTVKLVKEEVRKRTEDEISVRQIEAITNEVMFYSLRTGVIAAGLAAAQGGYSVVQRAVAGYLRLPSASARFGVATIRLTGVSMIVWSIASLAHRHSEDLAKMTFLRVDLLALLEKLERALNHQLHALEDSMSVLIQHPPH